MPPMPPMPPSLFCYHASLVYGGANMFLWKAMDTFVCEFQNNIFQLSKLFCLQRDWTKCYLCDCVYCETFMIYVDWFVVMHKWWKCCLSHIFHPNTIFKGRFFFSQPHRWKVNLTWVKKKEALVLKRYNIDMWAYCKQKW
jgi:hypothetical protein